jgi:hypothetical protein
LIVVGLLIAVVAGGGPARAGDYGKVYAEGLRHSRKAAALAGANNCKAAVPEYSKAFKMLKDPVLLFNRAECFRTLGQNDNALIDYRQFLTQLPTAPNRAQVEAQIAALASAQSAAPAVAPLAASKTSPPQPPASAASAPVVPQPGDFLSPSSAAHSAPIIGDGPDDKRPAAGAVVAAHEDSPLALPPPAVRPELDVVHMDPATMPLETAPSSPTKATADANRSILSRWWFWTIVAVVAGGAVATYFVLRSDKNDVPPSKLGTIQF